MSCEVKSRRAFLQQGGCGLFTLAAFGLGLTDPLPVFALEGTGAGDERTYPIPPSDGVNIDRSAQIIIVRFQGHAYAFALACPHEQAAVKWVAKDGRFQCTKHDSRYTPSGMYTEGRATRNLDRYPVRRDGASMVVTTDQVYRSDQDAAAWNAAAITV
jgi:nitrite reductase/ring-hydroxylating ferredoxin subunit